MSVKTAKFTTLALAATCGFLSVIALLQYGGWGKKYTWLPPQAEPGTEENIGNIHREVFKLPEVSSFVETRARPIFNDDRKPTPIIEEEQSVAEAEPPPPSIPLNVTLTGIVVTPQLRLVMLRDNMKNQPLALKEGMPMPGEAGAWTLSTIKPRSAVFKNTNGDETVEVELVSSGASPRPPPGTGISPVGFNSPAMPATHPTAYPAAMPPAAQPQPTPEAVNENKAAEDLQRRIEDRRRQIREEAERLRQQQEQQLSHPLEEPDQQ